MKNSLPQHVAIIPDGNRRWARRRGLAGWKGHLEGAKRVEEIARAAVDLNIKYLTVWGGSYDNLTKRSKIELVVFNRIFQDMTRKLLRNTPLIHEKKIRIRFIGEWPKLLNRNVVKLMRQTEAETAKYTAYEHSYFLGYNGDREMLDAINLLVKDQPSRVNSKLLKSYLWTADLPPVDLLIRTDGQAHLSNGFMMWDIQNVQLYFSNKLWPDFSKKEFVQALEDYARRQRRFGE